ncbi:MAG TPA: hypothetical protein VH352_08760 [Pseudonocardiaceae bacterium]|nr:hypothetical protein [Pseudonocardiaceae bacterium]
MGLLSGLVALGLILLTALGLRLRASVVRFGAVRGWLTDYLTDRTGMLRARRAALGVAVTNLKLDLLRNGLAQSAPRTINSSVEREDHRA